MRRSSRRRRPPRLGYVVKSRLASDLLRAVREARAAQVLRLGDALSSRGPSQPLQIRDGSECAVGGDRVQRVDGLIEVFQLLLERVVSMRG